MDEFEMTGVFGIINPRTNFFDTLDHKIARVSDNDSHIASDVTEDAFLLFYKKMVFVMN